MRRSKQDAEQTKQQLIAAACEVFYREGVARATLEQIAREAGVTRGALYWHFDNKVAILDALFEMVMPSINCLHECSLSWSTENYWQNLTSHFVDFFDRLGQDPQLCKFCTVMHLKCEMTESNAQVVALLNQYETIWQGRIQSFIGLAVEKNALPTETDVEQTSRLLRSCLLGIMVTYLSEVESKGQSHVELPMPVLKHMLSVLKSHPIVKNQQS